MSFAAAVNRLHSVAVTRTGETIVVDGHTVDAVVDRDVEVVDGFGRVTERRTRISFMSRDIALLERGTPVSISGKNYTIDVIEADDGHVTTAWLL